MASGTIRSNRMKGAETQLEPEKSLKKRGRGSFDSVTIESGDVCIIRWFDNKCVNLASNFTQLSANNENVRRYSVKSKEFIDIPCPEAIQEYNKGMGGIDLFDMLTECYQIQLGTKNGIIRSSTFASMLQL